MKVSSVLDEVFLDESLIGRKCHWMKVFLDESVSLDESVIGRNFLPIWMTVYLTLRQASVAQQFVAPPECPSEMEQLRNCIGSWVKPSLQPNMGP